MVYTFFLPFQRLPFHFVVFFCCAEAVEFDVVPFLDFCFCYLYFWYHIQKIIAKRNVHFLTHSSVGQKPEQGSTGFSSKHLRRLELGDLGLRLLVRIHCLAKSSVF